MNFVLPRNWRRRLLRGAIAGMSFVLVAVFCDRAEAQTFSSGSDGSDEALIVSGPPGTVVIFDPSQYDGSQVAANIFNFTTISIPQGVTLKLSGAKFNGPVTWLAQGDVDISGVVDLSGAPGHASTDNPFARVPSIPGPGGFAGGVGGNDDVQNALPGNGPGGGAAGSPTGHEGKGGVFSGNQFLIPLIGGSGGGGASDFPGSTAFFPGGGAGGGALLIASSTQIVVNGMIRAAGGAGGPTSCCWGGGGSGGAIRLVSNVVSGSGTLDAGGGAGNSGNGVGSPGVVRMESYSGQFGGNVQGQRRESSPLPLLLSTVGPATARVISIGGASITPDASTFPDITINTTSPVDVVIQTRNVPTTATVSLTILNQNGVADTVVEAPPLDNCDDSQVCTTTVPVVFPFGASRGMTRVTWVQ